MTLDQEMWSAALCPTEGCRRNTVPFLVLASSVNRMHYASCDSCMSSEIRWVWGRLAAVSGRVVFVPSVAGDGEE